LVAGLRITVKRKVHASGRVTMRSRLVLPLLFGQKACRPLLFVVPAQGSKAESITEPAPIDSAEPRQRAPVVA
jgi:hypothetical protein